ncbi:hypothetical protein NYQ35_16040 [Curtobacterium flaccumfaciens pv. flaccumfaciens]|uniref:hypothetical protein n=1 Tax=Curtobacterium flaccumfaciens TaxID=2035 RepID=UPI00217D1510|nr:hypothetical protein [Curtobacterium flaccumfaciens]MCS6570317.1 hypothetical protein [Curtobacterium flaccumfaciens pv. flaccumfaciens]MCS6585173.1 hypothetical protein [Curtobacterium flaccumfaciens pv. flaccumfaciens]
MPTKRTQLRAVEPDEAPPAPKAPLTLEEAAAAGDTLAELKDMRRLNARLMSNPNISGRDFAALSRRHMEIGREIESIEARNSEESEDAEVEDGAFDAEAI